MSAYKQMKTSSSVKVCRCKTSEKIWKAKLNNCLLRETYVYILSDTGEIFGPSGKLAQPKDKKGYVRFKQKSVHRLVALNFVPGYFPGAEVDHINAVRDDNRKENLRWVTPEQNKLYARDAIIASNKRRAKIQQANQR